VVERRDRLINRVRARLVSVRDRSPVADHGVRAVDRYLEVQGTLLAAAVSYYGFLAVFPMIAVAIGVASVVSRVAPKVEDSVRRQIETAFPTIDLAALARDGITVGIIGLFILAYAGVRWIGSLRRSVSLMWNMAPRSIGFLNGLIRDAVALVLLGGCLLASGVFSVVAQIATDAVSRWFGLGGRPNTVLVQVVVLAVSLLADFLVGWVLFRSLPNRVTSERENLESAAIFAVGFQVLVQLVGVILGRAGSSVIYGTFAATVGVLVWISYVSKLILFISAWAATRARVGDDDLSATG
jgi:membrane protein